jgi:aspartate dehydrogenase
MIMKKIKIGLVGCGAIGTGLAKQITARLSSKVVLAYLCDLDQKKAAELKQKSKARTARIVSLEILIQKSDIIVEAASASVSAKVAQLGLKAHKKVLIMSIGGLLKCKGLPVLLKKTKGELILPSGALAGLDAICAAQASTIKSATLTTSKPVKGLMGAPYFTVKGIDLTTIEKPTVVFEGSAREAIKYFPQNINVAVLLSFATIGPDKVKVQIITSPHFTKNSHHLEVAGDFGTITTTTENVPSPDNPKTSYLAVLSAFATLKKTLATLKIGT